MHPESAHEDGIQAANETSPRRTPTLPRIAYAELVKRLGCRGFKKAPLKQEPTRDCGRSLRLAAYDSSLFKKLLASSQGEQPTPGGFLMWS